MKKNFFLILLLFLFVFIGTVQAQEFTGVDYGEQVVTDKDLDGLTDQGEIQIFQTDPQKADSDDDGFSDGVEIMSGTDPKNQNVYPGFLNLDVAQPEETPWAWYVSRASGLMAFLLLYISIFLGLTLRIPAMRKIFPPAQSLDVHCWISLQATILAFLHGGVLFFDKFLNLRLVDLFVPFVSDYEPGLIALGIFSFYLMVILLATSYGKKYISHKLWRAVHFLNILLYVFVLVHAVRLGTDLKNPIAFNIFLFANAFLVFLMLANMQTRIAEAIRIMKARISK